MRMSISIGTPAKTIMDSVHGGIQVSREELEVIDHPLMQRLRRLRQTDVLSLVFPGATHSRFEHSIGVMHLAGRCFTSIASSGFQQRASWRKGDAEPIVDEIAAVSYFLSTVRLAALLHDIGHGPYSHQFESCAAFQTLFVERDLAKKVWGDVDRAAYVSSPRASFEHDELSIRVALEVLGHRVAQDTATQDVLCIMPNCALPPSDRFAAMAEVVLGRLFANRGRDVNPSIAVRDLLRAIVAGTLNADAMDYLLRDSHYSGSKYGVFNLDHLVENLRLGFSLDPAQRPTWIGLAIADRGLGALEDFIFSRLQLYKHVYTHKAVVGFKQLLALAFEEVLQDREVRRRIEAAFSNLKSLEDLHDDAAWAFFRDRALDDRDSACSDLLRRRRLSFLEKRSGPSEAQVLEVQRDHEAQDPNRRVLVYRTHIRADPTDRGLNAIRVLVKGPGGRKLADLAAVSPMLGTADDVHDAFFFGAKTGWARTRRNATRSEGGFLVCGMGIPCCGKSTILRYLAARLGGEYFREPEEGKWSNAVFERQDAGYVTALTWFRSVRVPHLFAADAVRKEGRVAVVDSYYDKLVCCYLGLPGMEWLIPKEDPYFASYLQLAEKDYELLPRPDLLVVFVVEEADWKRFRANRGRQLDQDGSFERSFKTQQYFVDAATRLEREQGVRIHIQPRRYVEAENATELAAEELLNELKGLVPDAGSID